MPGPDVRRRIPQVLLAVASCLALAGCFTTAGDDPGGPDAANDANVDPGNPADVPIDSTADQPADAPHADDGAKDDASDGPAPGDLTPDSVDATDLPDFDPGPPDAPQDTPLDASQDSPPDAPQDAASDLAQDTPPDVSGVHCGGATPSFPEFDKACSADDDCALASHQIDCCGTRVIVGISRSQETAFDAAEQACDSQYPGCGCAERPTQAEDGNTGFDPATFGVACDAGTCRSRVIGVAATYAGIPCGLRICQAGQQVCCVTASQPFHDCLLTTDPCGSEGFAATCDGPEDCGAGESCCDPSGVTTGNFCGKGGCLAQELTVCHAATDCRSGYSCCPATFQGWPHKTCQVSGAACP